MEIQITTESDVIFIVNLQSALKLPVRLFLSYTNSDNPSQQLSKVTEAAFLNTTVIQHIEFDSQVTFNHFSVEVGLFAGGVYGPSTRALGVYSECYNMTQVSFGSVYHSPKDVQWNPSIAATIGE